jgi:hypothetical protein
MADVHVLGQFFGRFRTGFQGHNVKVSSAQLRMLSRFVSVTLINKTNTLFHHINYKINISVLPIWEKVLYLSQGLKCVNVDA